jgi:hypothetical protein
MSLYNVFIVTADFGGYAIAELIFTVNSINSAMDFIEKRISRDEYYYAYKEPVLKSMNRSNCYTYVGNRNIIFGYRCINFGGFIIEKNNFLESWTNEEKEDFLKKPPWSVPSYNG